MVEDGKPEQAERIYKQVLRQAEMVTGETSALSGMVLIELFDFYEKRKRRTDPKASQPDAFRTGAWSVVTFLRR